MLCILTTVNRCLPHPVLIRPASLSLHCLQTYITSQVTPNAFRVSHLLMSLGHTGKRRVVLGHTLNRLWPIITKKNRIMFEVNLWFCVGLHSQPSWAACGLRTTGWTCLWETVIVMPITALTLAEDGLHVRTIVRFLFCIWAKIWKICVRSDAEGLGRGKEEHDFYQSEVCWKDT